MLARVMINDATEVSPLYIGRRFRPQTDINYSGLMDDVHIYDNALSSSQIAALAGVPVPSLSPLGIAMPWSLLGLAAYLTLHACPNPTLTL